MHRLIATLVLTLGCTWASAQIDDTDLLLEVLEGIGSTQGEFVQQQYDQDGMVVAESRGRFRLLRPDHFAWEIDSPDRQTIIADAQYLWHYDRDLETVTRRPVKESDQMSPLQVLGGNEAVLREKFTVERTVDNAFSLLPIGSNPGFQQLLVFFEGQAFGGLEIADNLNQRVVVTFEKVDADSALTPADFSFVPPEGADLFYYDE